MPSQEDVDKAVEHWGEQLLRPGLRRRGGPGQRPAHRHPTALSGAAIRAGLRAIVNRTPEVMVKVTGGGRGMGAIRAHLSYISRKGELALENQDGLQLKGREHLALLVEEWKFGGGLIPETSHRREAFHVMFSMPPGVDAQAVYFAARAFAREEFAAHKYALVLHDPATDPDSHRPHVHMIVRTQGRDGRRLHPKKAELARWRQEFADRLMERGVAASATRRQSRGVVQPAWKLRDHHRGRNSEKHPAIQSAQSRTTKHEVLVAWQNVAEALGQSDNIEDRDLGRQIADFKDDMPTVLRARNEWRAHRKQIDRQSDRQQSLALTKESRRERERGSPER